MNWQYLKNDYLSFSGRLNRWPFFWKLWLYNVAASAVAWLIAKIAGQQYAYPISLLGTWVWLSFLVRRLHDLNRSGWFALTPLALGCLAASALIGQSMFLFMIAYLALIAFYLCLLFRRGTDGPNDYGPDPLAK